MRKVICPFMSSAEKQVECTEDCALHTDDCYCALKNLAPYSVDKFQRNLLESLDEIRTTIEKIK